MNIVIKEQKQLTFGDLKPGDVFRAHDCMVPDVLFCKMKSVTTTLSAVRLRDFHAWRFDDRDPVKFIMNATLTVE